MPQVHLDDGAIAIEHLSDGCGHPGSVHPVKGLAEADDSEGAEGPGEFLCSHLDPVGILDFFLCGSALSLGQHPRIWVESSDTLEEVGEEQSDSARPATDVEEAPAAIKVEVLGESVGQGRGVRFSTLPVVSGGALEHGFVPDPVLPSVAHRSLRHVLRVPDVHGDGLPPAGRVPPCGTSGIPRAANEPASASDVHWGCLHRTSLSSVRHQSVDGPRFVDTDPLIVTRSFEDTLALLEDA